jgi:hypothetical protein
MIFDLKIAAQQKNFLLIKVSSERYSVTNHQSLRTAKYNQKHEEEEEEYEQFTIGLELVQAKDTEGLIQEKPAATEFRKSNDIQMTAILIFLRWRERFRRSASRIARHMICMPHRTGAVFT